MKHVPNAFFRPSDVLQGRFTNECYILNFDCFVYEDPDSNFNEIFFREYKEFTPERTIFIFSISDLDKELVECYKVFGKLDDSDCFVTEFYSRFKSEDLNNDSYMIENFHIDFNILQKKLEDYARSNTRQIFGTISNGIDLGY